MTITDELDALRRRIEASSDLIARCTLDAAAVRPEPGQVHVWLEPPSLTWTMWNEWDSEYTAVLVAGTVSTQATAARLMLDAITDMQQAGLNLKTAEPSGWKRDGQLVAAYLVTLTVDNLTDKEQ